MRVRFKHLTKSCCEVREMGCLFPYSKAHICCFFPFSSNCEGHDDSFERFFPIVRVTFAILPHFPPIMRAIFTIPLYSTAASSLIT